MKYFLILIILSTILVAGVSTQIPTKMFDVQNGNNLVKGGVTYPDAVLIAFKDQASRNDFLDNYAIAYNYETTLADGSANPQTKYQFFITHLQKHLKAVYKGVAEREGAKTGATTAATTADSKLP